jgi:hypothetical protein
MIRNLKALGLVLVAVFAMGAMVASAASAQGKLTSDGPVTLTGTETGIESNYFEAFAGLKVECPDSAYTGHKYTTEAETTHDEKTGVVKHNLLVPSGATTATLTPHYNEANHNCLVNGTVFEPTIDMNGCDYVIHLGATVTPGTDTYAVTFDVVCPPGKEITVTIWTNTDLHTAAGAPFCVVHVPPQVNRPGAHAKDTTNGHIDLEGTVTGITAKRTASATHPALCPHTTTTTAKFKLDVTVKGHNGVKGPTNISLTH